jgi:hypothetical protein
VAASAPVHPPPARLARSGPSPRSRRGPAGRSRPSPDPPPP